MQTMTLVSPTGSSEPLVLNANHLTFVCQAMGWSDWRLLVGQKAKRLRQNAQDALDILEPTELVGRRDGYSHRGRIATLRKLRDLALAYPDGVVHVSTT
jgi:hypothetical protein